MLLTAHSTPRGYGATAARAAPDQKVGSSNLSALISETLGGAVPRKHTHISRSKVARSGWGGWCAMGRRLLPCLLSVLAFSDDLLLAVLSYPITAEALVTCVSSSIWLDAVDCTLNSKGVWRNGSASDSRSEGWEFESLCPHI